MIEAALTSLERVGYYLEESKTIQSDLKKELSKLININEVNKEIQKQLAQKTKNLDDEPKKPGFDLLTIEHI